MEGEIKMELHKKEVCRVDFSPLLDYYYIYLYRCIDI